MPAYKDPKTGKWYCKFYYKDWNGERRQKKKSGFSRKREAAQWESEFLSNHINSPDISFSSVCGKYLELKKATWKPLTYQSRKSIVENHIIPHLGHMAINEITPLMISEWQKDELKKASKNSVKLYKTTLSAVFTFAVNNYGLKDNPCRKSEKLIVPRKEMRFITVEDFKKLAAASDDMQFTTALKVLFWSGMRWGEFAALTIRDIQPDHINVNKTMVYILGEGYKVQHSTKSVSGLRKVPIHQKLYKTVEEYINTSQDIQDASDDQPLFTISHRLFRLKLHRACAGAGLTPIRIHDLRHSHVALLIHMGLFPNAIAKRIGDIPDTVINTYAHIYEEDEAALSFKLNDLDD